MAEDINTGKEKPEDRYFGHEHVSIIEPHGSLLDLKIGELWAYRDLIMLFVRRDFVAQYKQTILGPLWHFLQPFLTTVIFTIVFGNIAKISTDGAPPFLFYMAGTVIWGYFAGVLTEVSNTFRANAHIFGKVYFPRLIVPVSTLMSKLIAFGFQFLFFLGFLAYYMVFGSDIKPNAWIFATPVLLLMMAMLGMGLGVIVSAVTVRYRDLAVLTGFGVQLFMYLSPVVYPMSALPDRYAHWMLLNPVAPIIEVFRYAFLGTGTANIYHLAVSICVITAIILLGTVLFNRVERTFMDTV